MSGLTEREISLLTAAVREHDPAAELLVEKLGHEPLTVDERERLRGAVLSEMLNHLDENSEPSPLGSELDDLIGALHGYAIDE
jgi:hypothetical protein